MQRYWDCSEVKVDLCIDLDPGSVVEFAESAYKTR